MKPTLFALAALLAAPTLLAVPAPLAQGHGHDTHAGHAPAAAAKAPIPYAAEWAEGMDAMHRDMDIRLSGDADLDFLLGMMPHHQGAIAMAELALKHAKDPLVLSLARSILWDQTKEIQDMETLVVRRQLGTWPAVAEAARKPAPSGGHGMHGGGMHAAGQHGGHHGADHAKHHAAHHGADGKHGDHHAMHHGSAGDHAKHRAAHHGADGKHGDHQHRGPDADHAKHHAAHHGTAGKDAGPAGHHGGHHGGPAGHQAVAPEAGPPYKAEWDKAMAEMHGAMDITLTGNPDVDFLRGMIPHHQGALDMADVALAYGDDAFIQDMAREVIIAQTWEIDHMRMLLRRLGAE